MRTQAMTPALTLARFQLRNKFWFANPSTRARSGSHFTRHDELFRQLYFPPVPDFVRPHDAVRRTPRALWGANAPPLPGYSDLFPGTTASLRGRTRETKSPI